MVMVWIVLLVVVCLAVVSSGAMSPQGKGVRGRLATQGFSVAEGTSLDPPRQQAPRRVEDSARSGEQASASAGPPSGPDPSQFIKELKRGWAQGFVNAREVWKDAEGARRAGAVGI